MQLLDNKTLEKEKVLRTLPSVGILVQGNWIVLSELLYPTDSVSGINGVPAEHMCRARDYIVGSYKPLSNRLITYLLSYFSSSTNYQKTNLSTGERSPSSRKYHRKK